MITLAIIGSRNYTDYEKMVLSIYKYLSHMGESHHENRTFHFDRIVSGGAEGVDTLADRFSKQHNIPIKVIRPNYKLYPPKIAPLIRNEEIIKEANIIFTMWDGSSRGTANALGHAKRLKKDTIVIYY